MNPLPNGQPRGIQTSEFWSAKVLQLLIAVLDLLVLLHTFNLTSTTEAALVAVATAALPLIEIFYQKARADAKAAAPVATQTVTEHLATGETTVTTTAAISAPVPPAFVVKPAATNAPAP